MKLLPDDIAKRLPPLYSQEAWARLFLLHQVLDLDNAAADGVH